MSDLGLAWQEAEAAMPEGWFLNGVQREWADQQYCATAHAREGKYAVDLGKWVGGSKSYDLRGFGDTPAEALRDLIEEFRG